MKIALVHKHYNEDQLNKVKSDMLTLGAPTIKAVWMDCYGVWAALEGCHRIRAAAELGLTPEIEEIEYSDEITTLGHEDGDQWMISIICDQAYNAHIIEF